MYIIPLQFLTDYQGRLKRFTNILNHLVSTDMDFTQLDAYLTSQMRRRQVGTSAAHYIHMIYKSTSTVESRNYNPRLLHASIGLICGIVTFKFLCDDHYRPLKTIECHDKLPMQLNVQGGLMCAGGILWYITNAALK